MFPTKIHYNLPEELFININLSNILDLATSLFTYNPLDNTYNNPGDSSYNPNKPIYIFTQKDLLVNLLNNTDIDREALYNASLPINIGIDYFVNSSYSDFGLFDDYTLSVLEESELVKLSEDYRITDNYGNDVAIKYNLKQDEFYFLNTFIYLYVREFISMFPELSNYIINHKDLGITLYLKECIDLTEYNLNNIRRGASAMMEINMNFRLRYDVECNILTV